MARLKAKLDMYLLTSATPADLVLLARTIVKGQLSCGHNEGRRPVKGIPINVSPGCMKTYRTFRCTCPWTRPTGVLECGPNGVFSLQYSQVVSLGNAITARKPSPVVACPENDFGVDTC